MKEIPPGGNFERENLENEILEIHNKIDDLFFVQNFLLTSLPEKLQEEYGSTELAFNRRNDKEPRTDEHDPIESEEEEIEKLKALRSRMQSLLRNLSAAFKADLN